jgi:2-deoxy-D-gluconate 3-dehydrogenase
MVLDTFRLDGRVALVTGAARGLGQAIACALAEAGADVVALDLLDCGATLDHIAAVGRRGYRLEANLLDTTPALAEMIVEQAVAVSGRLDILVNNAGIIRRAPALEFTEQDWLQVLQVNLTSAFYLAQAAARYFTAQQQTGKIINMCSMLSFHGGIATPSYTAAKSGLAGVTRALANELAAKGINVNAIAPGYMVTEVTAGIRADPERFAAMQNRIPAGRWGQPADLQGAAVYLASDASAYVHGTIIPVDGGWLAW